MSYKNLNRFLCHRSMMYVAWGCISKFLLLDVIISIDAITSPCAKWNSNSHHRLAAAGFLSKRIPKVQPIVLMMGSSFRANDFQCYYWRQNKLPPLSNKPLYLQDSKYIKSNFLESKFTSQQDSTTALQGSANRLNDINAAVGEKAFNIVTMMAELFGG